MLRIGMVLAGGIALATGAVITAGAGWAMLSIAASGAASSLGVLVSCAPTLPPEDEAEEESEQEKSKSS